MKKNLLIAAVILTVLMLATACAAPTPEPVPTATLPAPTVTIAPSITFTPLPTATETATPLPTMTATVTLTPTPAVDFSALKISSMAHTYTDSMWVMFTAPGLSDHYTIHINKVAYFCEAVEKVADTLVCAGQRLSYEKYVSVDVYSVDNSEEPVYATKMNLLSGPEATPTQVGAAQTWCPLRGTNVTCETEHRYEPDGTPCEVTSCFDACGYYYSIHTCSDLATFRRPAP